MCIDRACTVVVVRYNVSIFQHCHSIPNLGRWIVVHASVALLHLPVSHHWQAAMPVGLAVCQKLSPFARGIIEGECTQVNCLT